jgi:hypothetical protein
MLRKPLTVLLTRKGLQVLTAVFHFYVEQLFEEPGPLQLRCSPQIRFDPGPLTVLPGVLKAVTNFVNSLHQGPGRRITIEMGLIVHGAVSDSKE